MTLPADSSRIDQHLTREHDAISERLVEARVKAQPLPAFPGLLPETLEDAYAIQSASIGRWSDEIVGWKVGGVPEGYRDRLKASRLAGPIFRSCLQYIVPGVAISAPIYHGGFAAIEAEFVWRLGNSIAPVKRYYSDDELRTLVASLHVGAELASSPMAAVNELGPCCVVSDFGNNAGLLLGNSVPDWRTISAEALAAKVYVDDQQVGQADATAIEGGLLQALRFLIEKCADWQIELSEGSLISCGAVTGIHEVTIDSRATVDFGEYGVFDVAFESMKTTP